MRQSILRSESTPSGDGRGVSDVLAFMLVFAMVIGSVILMSTAGLQAMEGYQEGEQSRNAERAMTSLTSKFNDLLQYDGVTERYGELSLRGGTIRTGSNGTNVTINITGTNYNHEHDLGRFTYESELESDTVAYEGGGLVRSGDSGSIFLEDPSLTCNKNRDTALVSLVKIKPDRSRSIQSESTLGITITRKDRSRQIYHVDNETVSVSVNNSDTRYPQAWQSIDSGSEWTCAGVDTVAVTVVTANIDY